MVDLQEFLADYQSTFMIPDLPESIDQYYDIKSCLKHNANQQVFLLKGKDDEISCILKVAPSGSINKLMREHTLLLKLHDSAFPHPITCFARAENAFLLREYIPGRSLADYVENCEAIPLKTILSITCKVCNIVEKLHAMDPPIIHRDIKPQNIIISDCGTIHLVDLDTVQEHCPDKSLDTEIMGTAATAAPEQFGFKRSDPRADVYGIGMLLVFLFTGGYESTQLKKLHISPTLRRIIFKCLQFDPQKRYASVHKLYKQLLLYQPRWRRRLVWMIIAAMLIVGVKCIYTHRELISSYAEVIFTYSAKAGYTFASPLIEQAVRMQLGRESGSITIEEMRNIAELYLCGETPFEHWEDFDSNGMGMLLNTGYGYLNDLSDFEYLPNLRKLSLIRLELSDIKPLLHLPLTHLAITGNRITDISLLPQFKFLQVLDISDNPISDMACIRDCKLLDTLNISLTLVTDLSTLRGMALKALWIYDMPQGTDYSALATLSKLEHFGSRNLPTKYVELLETLPSLQRIFLFISEVDSLTPFVKLQHLTGLYLGANMLTSLDGIESMKQLKYLDVSHNDIVDLNALKGNSSIQMLSLRENPIKDLSALDQMSALTTLTLSPGQEQYFAKPVSELGFIVEYWD